MTRPAKPKRRKPRIALNLHPDELELLETMAKASRMSRSQFVGNAIRLLAGKKERKGA